MNNVRSGCAAFAALAAVVISTVTGFASVGPDAQICNMPAVNQFGRIGAIGEGTIAIGVAHTIVNFGNTSISYATMPSTAHPVMTGNLYRLLTVNGSRRFEQIGQGWAWHAFCALQLSQCATCNPVGSGCQNALGPGCSTPEDASLNATQVVLGPRSYIQPFTGQFPANAIPSLTAIPSTPISRRLQVRDADLIADMNPGADYYVEVQYVTADDAAAGNWRNNVGHRRVAVTGPNANGVFGFVMQDSILVDPAIRSWTSSTPVEFEPLPGEDGLGILAYEVTDLGNGQWHYEYAVYNMNLHDAIRHFEVPVPDGVAITNIGFHHPLNHDPEATGAPFLNDPWPAVVAGGAVTWSTASEIDNPNANAIRWGTLYNFRFDADAPPQAVEATLGLYRQDVFFTVPVLAPGSIVCAGDADGDGDTDLADLGLLLANFGCVGAGCPGDLDADGDVDLGDLGLVLSAYGCGAK